MVSSLVYSNIKLSYFDSALFYCRSKFKDSYIEKWNIGNESEFGFAFDDMPNFKHPLENLMLIVIVVIQNSGRYSLTHTSCLENIKKTITEYTLEKLTADLLPEEREDEFGFLYDLNLILENQKLEEK